MTIIDITTGFRVVAKAHALAATLTDSQRADLVQPRERRTMSGWSNLPQQVLGRRHRRIGLATGSLNPAQWAALDDLLATAMGGGVERVRAHLLADDELAARGGRYGYGRGEFVVAFLGAPSCHGTWQLQFGGHHLAVALTYSDGRLVGATPAFRGIEPFTPFERDGVPVEPERRSHAAFVALLASLDDAQRSRARLRRPHDDLVLGPGKDWSFPKRPEGLPGSQLDPGQRSLLLEAIASYVEDLPHDDAARFLARYESELASTCLSWAGSTTLDRATGYVRIDGPSVWIEYSLQDGINCSGPHPHAVWRDRAGDYGGTRF